MLIVYLQTQTNHFWLVLHDSRMPWPDLAIVPSGGDLLTTEMVLAALIWLLLSLRCGLVLWPCAAAAVRARHSSHRYFLSMVGCCDSSMDDESF